MHNAPLSSARIASPTASRPVGPLFRFLDSAILLFALVSVVRLQSWRWIDLRFAGAFVEFVLPWLWLASLVLLHLVRHRPPRDMNTESICRLNRLLLLPSILIALVLLLNSITFYHLKLILQTLVPWYMPMSLPVLAALTLWLIGRPDRMMDYDGTSEKVITAPCRIVRYRVYDGVFFALLFMVLFWIFHGMFLADPPPAGTDADVAVVFGAGTGPGDSCGYTLRQRVLEGVRLLKQHRAQRLLLTGRAPHGRTHPYENEPVAMLKLALASGIPARDIIIDFHGHNTRYSAYDTAALVRSRHWKSVIAVSSDYHLPRIALAFGQLGIPVWTVAARRGIWRESNPWAVTRELVGYPVYWLDRNYHRPGAVP